MTLNNMTNTKDEMKFTHKQMAKSKKKLSNSKNGPMYSCKEFVCILYA